MASIGPRTALAFPLGGDPSEGPSTLIIQPSRYSLRGGAVFQAACDGIHDPSYDDEFASLNATRWDTEVQGGTVEARHGLHLAIGVHEGSHAGVVSRAEWSSGLLSIDYEVGLHDANSADSDFCALELVFGGGVIRAARRFSSALSAHVVAADIVVGGVRRPGGFVESNDRSGSLSIAFWETHAAVYASGRLVWRTANTGLSGTARVAIRCSSDGGRATRTVVSKFASGPLLVIGDTPAHMARGVTGRRAIGTIPEGHATGTYDVNAYTRTGHVGHRAGGFTYVAPSGVHLGGGVTSESDPVVID